MAARTKRTTDTSAENDVRMAPENIQDGAMESIKQEKVAEEAVVQLLLQSKERLLQNGVLIEAI